MIYRYMNCSTDGYFARGRHSCVVLRILPHGTHLRVVRILMHDTHWRVVRILPRGAHSRAWCAFSRVAHSRAWYALARGAYSPSWYAFSRVVRICAWCALQPHLRIAQLEILQQLISVRFGKCDNFPDRFGSDMQKFRFNIGRFGLFFGTDYIGSYCLEGPIHFGIGIGPGARTGTNRPNASSDCTPVVGLDGTHLKSKYLGILLAATGVDANRSLFPLAHADVDSENDENWLFFLRLLHDII